MSLLTMMTTSEKATQKSYVAGQREKRSS
jgi:hypothetical protein